MKRVLNFIIGVLLGLILGWVLGFLGLPILKQNTSFWVGFIACLSCILIILIFRFMVRKTTLTHSSGKKKRNVRIIWFMIIAFIILACCSASLMIHQENKALGAEIILKEQMINKQSHLLEISKNENQSSLVQSLLKQVEEELESSQDRTLKDATIEKIASLSNSLNPYYYFIGDSLSELKLSPERGKLFLSLSFMQMDSLSFAKIIQSVSFSKAMLKGADLHGLNLKGVKLDKADLRDINLEKANLEEASLSKANLWGANLKGANLNGADIENSNLQWSNLNGAILSSANLSGSDLSHAKLMNANMENASLIWTKSIGTMFNQSNMMKADLFSGNFEKASFNKVKLINARIRNALFDKADLTGVQLSGVAVEEEWLKKVNKWKLLGAKEILDSYKIGKDSSSIFKNDRFYLMKQ